MSIRTSTTLSFFPVMKNASGVYCTSGAQVTVTSSQPWPGSDYTEFFYYVATPPSPSPLSSPLRVEAEEFLPSAAEIHEFWTAPISRPVKISSPSVKSDNSSNSSNNKTPLYAHAPEFDPASILSSGKKLTQEQKSEIFNKVFDFKIFGDEPLNDSFEDDNETIVYKPKKTVFRDVSSLDYWAPLLKILG